MKSEREVAQSCPTLSDPMDCSPPGSSVHGIFQARVLEWVAIAFSIENPPIMQESWVPSLDWEDPWKREQLTTPVFWSEEFHGQRTSSPWGLEESDTTAAAAAKSLQSCPTLRDPIDGSPPGSPVPGILQAKTLDFMKVKSESEVAQSCPTLSDRMDCNLPGSCVHWIFQSRVLEWVAIDLCCCC